MAENDKVTQQSTAQDQAPGGNQGQGADQSGTSPSQGSGGNQEGYSPSSDRFAKGQSFKDDPEWKRAQQGYTRTINDLQAQLNALRAESEQARMAGMSEAEKAQYAAEQWRQQAMTYAQRLQEQEATAARQEDLRRIEARTGVPASAIDQYMNEIGSNNANDAWDWAFAQQAQRQQGQQFQQAPQQNQSPGARQSPPPVNTGGGAAPSERDAIQRRYDEAKQNYNMGDMIAAMQEAAQRGIELLE